MLACDDLVSEYNAFREVSDASRIAALQRQKIPEPARRDIVAVG